MTDSAPRYLRPGFMTNRIANPLIAAAVKLGVGFTGAAILEVVGRSSGAPRTTPVNPLPLDGARFLVAPRGHTHWVRNLRAPGNGTLITRRGREPFTAVEVADADKIPVIRAYLTKWAMEVGAFFDGLSAQSGDDEIAAVAADFPAFRITDADS